METPTPAKATGIQKAGGITLLGAIAFLASMGINSFGQPDVPSVAWRWTQPTTGTEVEHYVAELQIISFSPPDTVVAPIGEIAPAHPDSSFGGEWEYAYQYGREVKLRVAGVDAQGRQGPWSQWSIPWRDDGPPSEPGAPSPRLVLRAP